METERGVPVVTDGRSLLTRIGLPELLLEDRKFLYIISFEIGDVKVNVLRAAPTWLPPSLCPITSINTHFYGVGNFLPADLIGVLVVISASLRCARAAAARFRELLPSTPTSA